MALDLVSETVSGCTNGINYQYGTDGKSWTSAIAAHGSSDISSAISTSKAITLYVRKAATSTAPATASATFSISKRGAAPTAPALVYNAVNYPDQAVLSSVDSSMEYKKSTDTQWTACSNGLIALDIPATSVTYYVRYSGVANTSPASANKSITLSARGSAPSPSLNITTEVVSSVSTAMEMSVNGSAYATFTSTTYDCAALIDSIASGGTTVLSIRKQATATAPASNVKEIILYARVAQPVGLSYDSSNKKITGVNSSMQYRATGASSWSTIASSATTITVTSLISAGHTQVEVRYKPVSGVSSASSAVVVNIS
ncbi:MAG: hypothetical protein LBC21_00465 [Oscillospiraceae bacterium]|nr:hypothetical protein [Oscillospiraceae bacterium]